ncbi:MAG: hypothetical protein WCR08_03355 [Gammaproteobacteria bacterium]
MTKKSNRSLSRKQMKRERRLQAAKQWITTYSGKNLIKGYKNWFGVDLVCAINELKILGVKLDEEHVLELYKSHEQSIIDRRKKKDENNPESEVLPFDSDERYYYIAGYTPAGFPYGITWDEA